MNAVHILMIGGKRCGKTTVLASMYEETAKVLAATSLSLTLSDSETQAHLKEAVDVIRSKMSAFDVPLTRVDVDENPTSAEKICTFHLKGPGLDMPIYMHDIPGEWLDDASYTEKVKELVGFCQVIIIAIDTPYLFSKMTLDGYGEYHLEYNRPDLVTNFFKEKISAEDLVDRLILFVPIKCERYYHLTNSDKLNIYFRNYMQELTGAVIAGYRDLIWYLRSAPALVNNCTIAITPILSAGGIDFVRFRMDEQTGKMVALYQKPEFLPAEESGFSPRFCEQPMIYTLVHILIGNAPKINTPVKSGFFGRVKNNPQSLRTDIRTLQKKMKRNVGDISDDGYYIVQNADRLLREP